MKTSLKIRFDLWRKAKVQAIHERAELQEIVNRALEHYLKSGGAR